ncbi:MAG: ACT domain-containing protein, partial [Myxococcota bacterium]|nr:ACT domain-containing protein [Myxococcota bacterium]
TFLLATSLAPDWGAARARIEREVPGIALESELGAVSIVGGVGPGAVLRVIESLAREDVATMGISQAATRVSVLVREADVDRTVRALHAAFVVPR